MTLGPPSGGKGRAFPALREKMFALSAIVLGLLALVAIFAEVAASDGPLLLVHDGRWELLPAVTRGAPASATGEGAFAVSPDDWALWPLVRSGPSTVTHAPPLSGSSREHPLGTDAFGRDSFARLVHGARTALGLGVATALTALVLGGFLGAIAGMLGGLWDGMVDRFTELAGAFPTIVLIALLRAIEGHPSLTSLFVAVVLWRIAAAARLTRALVLSASSEDWVAAARALGASPSRIVLCHVAPHLAAPLLISAVFSVGAVVLTETSLSFIGLGTPTEVASWGEMLSEFRWGAGPAFLVLPTLSLALTVGTLYVIADAIGMALDPRAGRRNLLP